ncbi:NAD(P)/FAD-dependent oxidoreductase [Streptomonospora sp. S1-112]|uniref:NAD(P)/FAD-dependent oxidoreductase n=1 Tax=Streptomonospora mangrovi TaxID=2883123 RepID=A0A9X3NKW5_9ACTN|nr:NAD(P)/FAD-dependent oxidoreductase [Streptomonospora mangrovi]MDA0565582.1 NAD(P)/FAD-dependent oxidoreductase [Streptomonospora mangrovi]
MAPPSVAIIGAGFGGLGMAVRLTAAGYRDVTVFEKADDVGGVWRDNTYPGAECDVPAHLYSFSFAPNPRWTRRFPRQPEIRDYLRACVRRYGLAPHLRLSTPVRGAAFDEAAGEWRLDLGGGRTHRARVLVSAVGQLGTPALPDIPGRDSFAGTAFHSARWRHDHDLSGRAVAVVGTGASAIQFVPRIQPLAERLTLFQIDAPHVLPKGDRPYGPGAAALFRALPAAQRLSRMRQYWAYEWRAPAFTRWPALMSAVDAWAVAHLRSRVADPGLRRALRPAGPPGCKRILLSDDYYPALERPNVEVVTSPITRIGPRGLTTQDGRHHTADTLVYGTGFAAARFLDGLEVTGLGGRDLHAAWDGGAEAYLGITVAGFPNLFLLYGPNTNLGHNSIVHMLESQIHYTLECVRLLERRGLRWLDVRPAAQRRFADWVAERTRATVFDRGCASWYRTASGRHTVNWPGSTVSYRLRTRRVRLGDYRLQPRDAPPPGAPGPLGQPHRPAAPAPPEPAPEPRR